MVRQVLCLTNNGNVWGSVDDEEDLSATVFMVITDDSLYFAADVIDDSYSFGDIKMLFNYFWGCTILEEISIMK